MIPPKRRNEIYSTVFQFFLENDICFLPTPIEKIYKLLGLKAISSNTLVNNGFDLDELFEEWGNEDGVLQTYTKGDGTIIAKVAYNENKCEGRKRFTFFEEAAHFLLGHHLDSHNDRLSELFDEDIYMACDEEARIAAGLMICPPSVFYSAPSIFMIKSIRNQEKP